MALLFKSKELEAAFLRAHPSLQAVAVLFVDYSEANHLPEPVITDVMDKPGSGRNPKTTWHRPTKLCAVDFRNTHYSRGELATVEAWFKARFDRPLWELITEPHGTAPHIHLARRDWNFKPKKEAADGRDESGSSSG